MAGGLHYDTGRDMPPGMQELAIKSILARMKRQSVAEENDKQDAPATATAAQEAEKPV